MHQEAVATEKIGQQVPTEGDRLDAAGVKEAARGRWISILETLAPVLGPACGRVGKHVPCPIHGGKDGFRLFRDAAETGGAICASCGARPDGFDVLQWVNGWTFPRVLQEVAGYLGIGETSAAPTCSPPPSAVTENGKRRKSPLALWESTVPDTGRISTYLRHRGLSGTVPPSLRLHPELTYYDGEAPVALYAGMLAQVLAPNGEPVSLHRTYLDSTGPGKAPVSAPKKLTSPVVEGATKGAAIRLFEAGETLALAEGVESAIAIQEATGLPAWASVSASGLEAIEIPAGVKRVEIWADNDENGTGQTAARKAAERLRATGLEVCVLIPDRAGKDWLDILVERGPDALRSARSAHAHPDWEPPAPFFEHNLPPFPCQALPGWLRAFVEGVANSTQTPPDLCGMVALSSLAAAVAGKVVVEIRDGYREPLNLFTVTALPPGNRKSTVFSEAVSPLEDHEEAQVKESEKEIAEAATRRKIAEDALEYAVRKAAKAKPEDQKELTDHALKLARELAEMVMPVLPRLLADDCSPEKLASLLRDQEGRMAVMSPEGDVFEMMAGRYSSNGMANFGVFLKGHAGDTLRVDRVSRPSEFVKKPALTLGLTVQPDVIRGLMAYPGFKGRGLLGRFLYAMPVSLLGKRDTDPPPMTEEMRTPYRLRIRNLLALRPGLDQFGNRTPWTLRYGPEAQERMKAFAAWIEPRLAESGDLGVMTDWGGKLVGAVARITGNLHMAEFVGREKPWQIPIQLKTVENAILLGEYLIAHAKAAYAEMGADPLVEEAMYLVRWIRRKGLRRFTRREAYQDARRRFKKVEEMDPPLQLLVEHGHIRQEASPPRKGAGRNPSPVYAVNPRLFDSVDSVNSVNGGSPAQKETPHPDQGKGVHSVDSGDTPVKDVSETSSSLSLDGPPLSGEEGCSQNPRNPQNLGVVNCEGRDAVS